jgi:hypothetical protein
MSKKISSIIIIFFTMLYVFVGIYLSEYNIFEMNNTKAIQIINSIKKIDIMSVLKPSKNPKVVYEEVKQNSEIVVINNAEFEGKLYKLNILKMSNSIKKNKLENIYFSERVLRESIYDKTPIYTSSVSIDNKTKTNEKEVTVFNTEASYVLTEEDKERILTLSKKLSPLDQEKINTYLKYISDVNAKNAINLLRDRLSDKDFEKIKELSLKFNKK